MGTGDRTDPTTDFFATHRAQCVEYANHLRDQGAAAEIVAKLDAHVTLCDQAIARGSRREDMAAIDPKETAAMFEALSPPTKTTFFQRAKPAPAPREPKPADTGAKAGGK